MADTLMNKARGINLKECRFTSCDSGGYDDNNDNTGKQNPALRTVMTGPNGLPLLPRDTPKDIRDTFEEVAKEMGLSSETMYDPSMATELHAAAMGGSTKQVRELLRDKRGFDPHVKGDWAPSVASVDSTLNQCIA
jgi:hypothetical protein